MSKIALTPNANGSGVFTLASPNSNTNRTITLPDESVTLGAGTPSIDDNGNATAITIDSSENVFVGKTSAGLSTAGVQLDATGSGGFCRAETCLTLSRLSTDGSILDFRKDSTTVGSIGTVGNQSYIHGAGTDVGIYFGSNNIYPYRSTGLNDATIDLGQSAKRFKDLNLSGGVKWTEGQVEVSNSRLLMRSTGDASGLRFDGSGYTPFKNGSAADGTVDLGYSAGRYNNIYLSGGIYLGGVVGANKLDDYEEGTFTAGVETGTVGGGDGVYVKVGDMVYVGFTIGNFSNTSSGNAIVFNGLPFASNSNNHGSNGSVFCRYISGGFPDASQVNTSATTGRMWKSGSTAWASVNHNDITNGTNAYFFVCLTYRAA